jgi:ElaB/YqjD/DUF883 family membrane-anchored ribosome-binding protein
MSTINQTLPSEFASSGQLKSAFDAAQDRTAAALARSESCVRKHPESAVWTAFGSGLLLGTLLAWVIVEERQHHWRSRLVKFAGGLGH